MTSDSSEEENIELLKEAANNEFTARLFNPNREQDSVKINGFTSKPSLRNQDEEETTFMNVTPQFQHFVATQLMKLLDSQIKEVNTPLRYQRDNNVQGGIHLFATSTNLMSCEESVAPTASHSRKRILAKTFKKNSEDMSEEEKCQAAAVHPEWVLSQEAVSGWEPCTKGKLEIFSRDEVQMKKNNRLVNESPLSLEDKKRLKRQKCRERLKRVKKKQNEKDIKETEVLWKGKVEETDMKNTEVVNGVCS